MYGLTIYDFERKFIFLSEIMTALSINQITIGHNAMPWYIALFIMRPVESGTALKEYKKGIKHLQA